MKRLLRLYPAAWRERYEDELADLLTEFPASPSVLLDLIRGALIERSSARWRVTGSYPIPAGGQPMFEHPVHRHPTRLALLALLLVTPTLLFVVTSVLAYQLEVPGMEAVVDPLITNIAAMPWIDVILVTAPFVAAILAAIPLVGIGSGLADGERQLTLTLRARALNVFVLVTSVLLGGVLFLYLLTEFVLEAAR
ncbi:MAG TPA: hypothetical protein VFP83_06985 [Candidatus Limnocylindria bacterium]|nr:hypothetical protein [Candidatus Limnocylindria bacterium]